MVSDQSTSCQGEIEELQARVTTLETELELLKSSIPEQEIVLL